MRRRLSLALLAVLVVVVALVSTRYVSSRNQARRVASRGAAGDSVARLDSAAQAEARQSADTMCMASRIFLPCDPR